MITFTSCSIMDQVAETIRLVNCKFNIDNVNNIKLANVDISNNTQLSLSDITNLTTALVRKSLPLMLDVNIGILNPGGASARLGSFDWVCAIDNNNIVSGTVNKVFNIPSNGKVNVPISVNVDVFQIFSDGGIDAIKKFIDSFSSDNELSSRIALKVKPSITVGNKNLYYPGYIKLEKEFK